MCAHVCECSYALAHAVVFAECVLCVYVCVHACMRACISVCSCV